MARCTGLTRPPSPPQPCRHAGWAWNSPAWPCRCKSPWPSRAPGVAGRPTLPCPHPADAQGVREGNLAFEGKLAFEATTQNARVQITTEALALQLAAPYVAQHLEPTVAGQLTGTLGVQWQAPPATKTPRA